MGISSGVGASDELDVIDGPGDASVMASHHAEADHAEAGAGRSTACAPHHCVSYQSQFSLGETRSHRDREHLCGRLLGFREWPATPLREGVLLMARDGVVDTVADSGLL